jgi:phosphatidylserine decarboxylase
MGFWKDCTAFWHQFRTNYRTTGSILPSSSVLGRALTSNLRKPRGPARILEVGPGTGPVTREILRVIKPDDHLTAVEINPQFVAHLRQRFATEPPFRRHQHRVELIEAPVENVPGEGVYDFIISGLPLNNFHPHEVRAIFRTFMRLLKPTGKLSYFEYILLRQLKTPFSSRSERLRLIGVGEVVNEHIRDYQFRCDWVFVNVPPANVRHMCFQNAAQA